MTFIPEIELQPPAAIRALQNEKLGHLLRYLQEHSPFYRTFFQEHGVHVEDITIDDLADIPPTTKDDLQRHNWEFLCVPRNTIIEYTSTSGTLGKPVTIALTALDLQRLAYNECLSFACADGSANDVYQLMLTLDRQFMAGIAYYEGIRKLGGALIRVGPGLPAMQWDAIHRFQPTTLVAVPSFIVKLIDYAIHHHIDLKASSVKKIICIGEPLRTADFRLNTLGNRIREQWPVHLYGTYASTEMQTAFTECSHGVGGHLHPELLIVELLDENNQPVEEGPGEVTITTLGVEGMPLLRYKTGDIATLHTDKCLCGRTTPRLGPIVGRKQQMIKLKGTTVYPSALFDLLAQVETIHDFVIEAYTGSLGTDEVKIHFSVTAPEKEAGTVKQLTALFQSHLRVIPDLFIIPQATLETMQVGGSDRKLRRFIDSRQ